MEGCRPFHHVRQQMGVRTARPLLQNIADHVGKTAVRNIELVAGGSGFGGETVVENVAFGCPGFYQMPHRGVMRVAEAEGEFGDPAELDIVGLAGPVSIEPELGVLH